ncbi:SPFH domain-containing protein [Mucisphaera calidilacus]|uniref:Band 7 domain-containing protein n=1 Tax=Mucisphaera calidilacus TaxID=2527982 RepID=A0A518C0M8_9BACT|nr:SPFH domain-containing protein [Mucisphaera calidilacus]QDU72757.1 hypothetical protein Pan265_26310 [Mucisphaera calidilacus]
MNDTRDPLTELEPTQPAVEAADSMDAQELDAAQQSLADAMQVSFRLLTVIMVCLVLFYIFGSGWFQVSEQEKAVRLFFGEIAGDQSQQVLEPGWKPNWPYPVGENVRIPTAPRTIMIDKAFWFEVTERDQGKTLDEMAGGAGPLNPELDGALITGDANVVHAQFEASYRIGDGPSDPINYVTNVGDVALADALVRSAAESGIIRAVAEVEADDAVRGRINQNRAKLYANEILDGLATGIEITTLPAKRTTMPLSVLAAYRQVNDAESERANLINQARQEATQILRDTAGPGADGLFRLIQDFELAQSAGDAERAAELQALLDRSLTDQRLPEAYGGEPIVGEVRSTLNGALAFRTQEVEQIRTEVQRFESLLEMHGEVPAIVENRVRENARRAILGGEDNEAFWLAPGEIRIQVNRDPDVQRRVDERRLQAIQEQSNERREVIR